MYLSDHLLSDIEVYCPLCEDWDRLNGVVDSREELVCLLAEKKIYEHEGDHMDCFAGIMSDYERMCAEDYAAPSEPKEELPVGLFFYVEEHLAFSGCPLSKAEPYGDFLVYPGSHFAIWEGFKYLKYIDRGGSRSAVDYDYFPRGRIVYRKSDDTFIIYHDRCITDQIDRIACRYRGYNVRLELDEHYCCHMCNEDYVM